MMHILRRIHQKHSKRSISWAALHMFAADCAEYACMYTGVWSDREVDRVIELKRGRMEKWKHLQRFSRNTKDFNYIPSTSGYDEAQSKAVFAVKAIASYEDGAIFDAYRLSRSALKMAGYPDDHFDKWAMWRLAYIFDFLYDNQTLKGINDVQSTYEAA